MLLFSSKFVGNISNLDLVICETCLYTYKPDHTFAYIAVADLNLDEVHFLKGLGHLAIGKHLCGPATGECYICS